MGKKKRAEEAASAPVVPVHAAAKPTLARAREPDIFNWVFGPDSDVEDTAPEVPRKDQSSNLSDFGAVKKMIWQDVPASLARRGYAEDTRVRDRRSLLLLLAIMVAPAAYFLPADTEEQRIKLYLVFAAYAVLYLAQWLISPPRSRMLDVHPSTEADGIKTPVAVDDVPASMFKPTEAVTMRLSTKASSGKTVVADGVIPVTSIVDAQGYVVPDALDKHVDDVLAALKKKLA